MVSHEVTGEGEWMRWATDGLKTDLKEPSFAVGGLVSVVAVPGLLCV